MNGTESCLVHTFESHFTHIACTIIFTSSIVPYPVEHPQHYCTMFIPISIIGLIVVPVCITQEVTSCSPSPLTFDLLIIGTNPEITVTQFWRKHFFCQKLRDNVFIINSQNRKYGLWRRGSKGIIWYQRSCQNRQYGLQRRDLKMLNRESMVYKGGV